MAADVERGLAAHGVASHRDVRLAVSLIAATAAFALAAFAPQLLNDGDTFLHIAAGAKMLGEHAIVFRDPFSYTFAGQPWQAHEWFAEIVMAAAFRAGGWSGLVLFFALSFGASVGLLAHQLGRWFDWRAQALGTVIAFSCMTASLLARPHLLALPLLVLWTGELVRARSKRQAPSLWLLPLMVVWANIHGSFLLGLALAGALGLEAIALDDERQKNLRGWTIFGVSAALAALLNPHFVDGVLFPLRLMGTAGLSYIGEWRPLDLTQPQPLEFIILAALYFAVTRGVKLPAARTVMVLALLHMALLHQRHLIVFAVVAPLLLAEPLSRNFADSRALSVSRPHFLPVALSLGAMMLMLALAAGRILMPVTRSDSPVAPIAALSHVPTSLRTLPVLNDYSFGGYLIFEGAPVFIDSRTELYGDAFLRQYAQLITPDPAVAKKVIGANKIRWTLLSPQSPLVSVMDSLAGWRRSYADKFAVVHIQDKYDRKRD